MPKGKVAKGVGGRLEGFELLERPWMGSVLGSLLDGNEHFNEIARSLQGITPKTLSARLVDLEEWRVVERLELSRRPVRTAYRLRRSPHVKAVVAAVARWSREELTAKRRRPTASGKRR